MKLIFVNRFFHPDLSATAQLLSDLTGALAAQGHAVHVVTSRQRIDVPGARLPATETVGGVRVHRVWTSRFGRGRLGGRVLDYASFCLSAARCLQGICTGGDVLIAKTDPPLISVVVARIARECGARQVNWVHDLFPEIAIELGVPGVQGRLGVWLKRLRNASLATASMNVAIGQRMAERLMAEGIPTERVRVIHNWCDGDRVRPRPAAGNPLREAWGLTGRFVVGYSGNMGRAHEFGTLLGAASRLRDEDGIRFLFTGDGVQRAWIEEQVRAQGLANVVMKPYQPQADLGDTLGVADVHVVSLRPDLEGLIVPSKFYAIAAAGRASVFIGARDGEIARILSRDACGVTVEPGASARLAETLRGLAAEPERGAAMGQAARQAFDKHFTAVRAREAWTAVLTEQ